MPHENIKIKGFSRLLMKVRDASKGTDWFRLEYAGVWMSKDSHWLIAPTSGRASYQLLALTQDAGIRLSVEFKDGRLIGTLEDILKGLSKVMMYTVLREPHEVTHGV